MALITRDRGKDANTRLEFFIVKHDGAPAAAYLDIEGQGLYPNTTVAEVIPPGPGGRFSYEELSQEQLLVKIDPKGNNTWTYAISATLRFSDGTTAIFNSGNEVLTENNKQELIPLTGLTIIPPPKR